MNGGGPYSNEDHAGSSNQLGENPNHLRGQGSPVKLICWGLAEPNRSLKKNFGKGRTVNIPLPCGICLTLGVDALGSSEHDRRHV